MICKLWVKIPVDKEVTVDLLTEYVNRKGQFVESVFVIPLEESDRQKSLKYI
ncbi:MAG: hypothetical protein ACI9UA_003949 [Pseudoalteromonas tetraodonis]|jgi:hypothetical protein